MEGRSVQIAILLFDGITALDAVGPYDVLRFVPGAETVFVASNPGPIRTDGGLTLLSQRSIAEVPAPEILVVPGGSGSAQLLSDRSVLDWIREAHRSSRWTTSVCSGSLVLGAAGILHDLRATSHWRLIDSLRQYGAEPVDERVVRDGKIITSAGVSAGIDMALTLVGLEWGEAVAKTIQLAIEYDPQPPYDAGSPAKAPAAIVERLRAAARS